MNFQKDIVDFYYAWKWTDSAKGIRISRRRRRTKGRFPSINCIFGELNSPRIQTRSALAASKDSTVQKINGICSCDSSSDNSTSTPKRKRNACSATGDITPQKNQETYHPDSSTFTAKWKRKSSIAYRESIPEKVLDIFHRESLCGNSTSIALKKQNSSTQSAYRRRSDRYSFKKRFSWKDENKLCVCDNLCDWTSTFCCYTIFEYNLINYNYPLNICRFNS